jgi:hypothetical protein
MVMLILLTLCIGALLGARYKVLILAPFIGLSSITILAAGIARGDNASAILIAAVLALISLQIGYFCGIFTRYGVADAQSRHSAAVHQEPAR